MELGSARPEEGINHTADRLSAFLPEASEIMLFMPCIQELNTYLQSLIPLLIRLQNPADSDVRSSGRGVSGKDPTLVSFNGTACFSFSGA